MPAALAAQKGNHLSLLQISPSIRRAQARAAVQNNDKLLLTLLEKPAIRASFGLRGDLEGTAAERAEAAVLVHGFYAHDAIRIRSDILFPSGDNVISGDFEKFGEPSFPADMAVLRDIFRDIAYIEEQLKVTLPLPPAMSAEDAGLADYPIPQLKLVKFVALGTTPDAPARVRLAPVGGGEITFRLIRPAVGDIS